MSEQASSQKMNVTEIKALRRVKKYFRLQRSWLPENKQSPKWDFCSRDVEYAKANINEPDPYYKIKPIFGLGDYPKWGWDNQEKGIHEILEYMKMFGLDLTVEYRPGESVLHYYIGLRVAPVANALIRAGADVSAKNPSGETPLIKVMLCSGKSSTAILLVQYGADPFQDDNSGSNAFDYKRRCNCSCIFGIELGDKIDKIAASKLEYDRKANIELITQAVKDKDLAKVHDICNKYRGYGPLLERAFSAASSFGYADFLDEMLDCYQNSLRYPDIIDIVRVSKNTEVVEVAFRYTKPDVRKKMMDNVDFSKDYKLPRINLKKVEEKTRALEELRESFKEAANLHYFKTMKEILAQFEGQPQSKRGGPRALQIEFENLLRNCPLDVVQFFNTLSIPKFIYQEALLEATIKRDTSRMAVMLWKFENDDILELTHAVLKQLTVHIHRHNSVSEKKARKVIFPEAYRLVEALREHGWVDTLLHHGLIL